MRDLRGKTVLADAFHAPVRGEVEILAGALIGVGQDGAITSVIPTDASDFEQCRSAAQASGTLATLPAGSYLLPGFVDLHIHAPQYPQLGTALDVPLEVWLQTFTFPLEARYADLPFARAAYGALVDDLLATGTTTAMMFATIHTDATRVLADICVERGLRALIGKVAMDKPGEAPDFYRDVSVDAAVEGTRAVIEHVRSHPDNRDGRVRPVVTPRFIPTCTDPLLEGLGAMAKACGCHVQTHCSESDWQHAHVRARTGRSDAESLDGFGLLTRHTVLAHATLLGNSDMDLIGRRGAGIAHCPLSNIYFSNAVFPLRAALAKGLRVGLGTDISGGPSGSMFEVTRMAVHASRLLEEGVDPALPPAERGRPGARIDWRTAFHLATAGGADALDLPVGRFEAGRQFDAVLVDTQAKAGTIRLWAELDGPEQVLQKILYTASRANVAGVWVAGEQRAG